MKKLVGEKSGVGILEGEPGESHRVQYRIHEYVDRVPAGTFDDPGATLDGLPSAEGRLVFNDGFWNVGNYVLHLASGEKLRVVVSHADGESASFVGSGSYF